jgi:hypothetical protein
MNYMGGWLSSGLEGGHCHIRHHSAKTKNNLVLKICYMFRNAPNFAAPRPTSPRYGELGLDRKFGHKGYVFSRLRNNISVCVPALVSSKILDILTTTE